MSNWWQELLRFFLRGLTLQQLIHMLIILIALIIITPASIKEWVDIRNPEILPDHWMYYAMLLCISYVLNRVMEFGFAPIFPDICYHLTHYKPAAADIPVASDNPAHYADAIRYNARTPLQGSLLPLTRLVWA